MQASILETKSQQSEMVATQAMTQAMTERARAVVKAILEVAETRGSTGKRNIVGSMGPKAGWYLLEQPMLDLTAKDKYTGLKNLEMEVTYISWLADIT